MNIRRLIALVKKEFILMRRDTAALFAIFVFPIVILLLHAYAVSLKPRNLHIALLERDSSIYTQKFILAVENTKYFNISNRVNDNAEGEALLKNGTVSLFIYIPDDFTRRLLRGERPEILVSTDMSINPPIVSQAVAALQQIQDQLYADDAALQPYEAKAPFEIVIHNKFNPAINTQYFLVPTIIVFILMFTLVQMMVIVSYRDRTAGTYEFLLITPLTPGEIIGSIVISYIILGFLQFVLAIAIAYYIVGIPIVGNVFLLLIGIIPYLLAELSFGMVVAFCTKSLLEGTQLTNFQVLLTLVFSGLFYSIDGIPLWGRVISECMPITHEMRIIRSIMLKGMSLNDYLIQNIPILIVTCINIAIIRHRVKLKL